MRGVLEEGFGGCSGGGDRIQGCNGVCVVLMMREMRC